MWTLATDINASMPSTTVSNFARLVKRSGNHATRTCTFSTTTRQSMPPRRLQPQSTIRTSMCFLIPHIAHTWPPSDYYLFRHLKQHLRGERFENSEDIKETVMEFFNSRSRDFFLEAFRELPTRWRKCIENEGGYIEKK